MVLPQKIQHKIPSTKKVDYKVITSLYAVVTPYKKLETYS